jgi:hypothetical protein
MTRFLEVKTKSKKLQYLLDRINPRSSTPNQKPTKHNQPIKQNPSNRLAPKPKKNPVFKEHKAKKWEKQNYHKK